MEGGSQVPSDAELLRASDTDGEAFGLFYDRHVERMLAFFLSRTACAQTAADLTAETFAQAFISRKRYRDVGVPATAWLFTIARRQLSRAARGRVRIDRARLRLGLETPELTQESIERIEELVDFEPTRQAVRKAMEEMPAKLAAAVALRIAEELPYSEVARRLVCTEQAARQRVARGLSRLTEQLEDFR